MRRRGTLTVKFDPRKSIDKMNGRLRLAHANRVWAAMRFATKVALEATPAWTGDTRANYRWSVGRAGSDYTPYNQTYNWRAKIFPVGPSGADAKTMAALEAMRSTVYKDPYQRFVLYNRVIYEGRMTIRDLEYGSLTGTPHMMLNKARQAIEARLG